MNYSDRKMAPGQARHPGPSTADYIHKDRAKMDEFLIADDYKFLGDEDMSTDMYLNADFARLEEQKLWPHTWQWACREEHIPNVGDYIVYDIAHYSFIITRTSETEIKAYYNACLHRGTKLRASGSEGCASDFTCSFHGWSWNLDGTIKNIPCRWDFPHVKDENITLPTARVELWGGFVWINMDEKAPSFREYVGPKFLKQFEAWELEKRYVAVHIIKRIPANWKLMQAAFFEAYHVHATHPQITSSSADANTQYDIYGDHVGRFVSLLGVQSPHLNGKYSEQEVLDVMVLGDRTVLEDANKLKVPEGGTAREVMGEHLRKLLSGVYQVNLGKLSDSEMLDCFSYNVFPNCFLFPGISLPMVYRFRPDPKDHTKSLYELIFMRPVPENGERPEPAEPYMLAEDQSFGTAPGMDPGFGVVFDQDTDNVSLQQEGMKASKKKTETLGNYQEIRLRQFNQTLAKYINRP
jgi:phenylpropionate dioxygenase-like ring-hydroxylating dioxygenase large terminal subunit